MRTVLARKDRNATVPHLFPPRTSGQITKTDRTVGYRTVVLTKQINASTASDARSDVPQQKGQSNARGLARREEILEAASELFATRGYRGSGILELAKRVGMSHVGILHHFGTKENLLRAVIERRDEKYDHLMSEYVDGGLDAFMEAYVSDVNSFMEPEVLTRLGTVLRSENLSPGDPLNEYFDGRTKQVRD